MLCLCVPVHNLSGDFLCQGLGFGLFEESVLPTPWGMPL